MLRAIDRYRKRLILCLALLFIMLPDPHEAVLAQMPDVKPNSSPNPVGSGARALGMGGAFIAVADDATAASWNPGGLIQLERPEISVVGEGFEGTEDNTFTRHPETSGKQTTSRAGLNFLSAAYPFTFLDRNMIVSLNYQHLYDFSRDWTYTIASRGLRQSWDYEADGGLYAWGIAYCVQIIPRLSLGVTFNIWEDGIYQNGWKSSQTGVVSLRMSRNSWQDYKASVENHYSFDGFNANLGLLWNITDQLTLGVVFKSPFTANLNHEYEENIEGVTIDPRPVTTHEDLHMPMSYGMGLAYRFSDRFTISGDIYRTQWDDFILTQQDGTRISPVTNRSTRESDIDATTQVRLGAEYLFIKPNYTIPVRAGFFYDPAPAQGSPDDYYGFSLGTGIGIGRFILDAAYVYRFGTDVGESLFTGLKLSQDVNEHNFYTSLIIHF
jgi:long-subunit fatty acid transport protein